jgi:hypothetical protein
VQILIATVKDARCEGSRAAAVLMLHTTGVD